MPEIIKHLLIVFVVLAGVFAVASGLIWLERRLLALWQDRYGPNRVGPFGLLQVLADVIKILQERHKGTVQVAVYPYAGIQQQEIDLDG